MLVGKSIAVHCSSSGARCGTKMLMSRPSTYEINSTYFAPIDTPHKAYWLGVLAADGCVYYTHNKWRFQFIVAEKDQSWLLMFRNEVGSNHPVRILPGGFGTPCCRFVVTNQDFCSTLLTLNFKSADILQRVAEALRPHFIRGLFDGDGSIRKERGIPYIARCILDFAHFKLGNTRHRQGERGPCVGVKWHQGFQVMSNNRNRPRDDDEQPRAHL
jgi:hypothetical protein